jgi:hypothetical protein
MRKRAPAEADARGTYLGEPRFGYQFGRVVAQRGVETARSFPIKKMAGRYQGYHWLPNHTGSVEVFWRSDGWWWRSRSPGCPPEGVPTGPFITSTDAYLNASGGALLMPRPAKLENQGPAHA